MILYNACKKVSECGGNLITGYLDFDGWDKKKKKTLANDLGQKLNFDRNIKAFLELVRASGGDARIPAGAVIKFVMQGISSDVRANLIANAGNSIPEEDERRLLHLMDNDRLKGRLNKHIWILENVRITEAESCERLWGWYLALLAKYTGREDLIRILESRRFSQTNIRYALMYARKAGAEPAIFPIFVQYFHEFGGDGTYE